MQNLGLIGAGDSQALDINNNENIVGVTGITSLGDSNRAFRWTPSTGMVLIDSENSGQASGLNSNDVAIGHRNLPTGNATRVRTWSPTDSIGNPYPFANLYGIAINDLGQFVGADPSQFGPVRGRYSPGSGPTINLNQFIPSDLNNARQIVGYERIDAQSGLAGLIDLDTNTKTILGKLAPSDASSQALGINQAGTIVGVSGASGAFITDQNHNLLSLTSLLDPAFSGWTILSADDINNAGQIVALGQFQDGLQHAVLLSPVPEPSTWLLATIAVLSVALRRSYLHHC